MQRIFSIVKFMKNPILHISGCAFLILLFSSPVCAQPPAQGTPSKFSPYAPDRVLVAFEPGTLGAEKKALHAHMRASVLKTIPALGVDVVKVPAGTVLDKVNLYDKNPNVRYAEPDYYRVFWMPKEGAEPFATNMFNEQWALNNTGQKMTYCDSFWGCLPLNWAYIIGTSDADIDAPEAWDIGRSHSDIKIAILDSGIDWTSIDLETKKVVGADKNFVESYENTLEDVVGHGTHVAGIAAAECDNFQGIAGVACEASLVSLKVCYLYMTDDILDPLNGAGVCPASAVVEALAYAADHHFDVANMSFGTDQVDDDGTWIGLQGYSNAEYAAVTAASNAGVVLVAAAGNDGTSGKSYPAAYDDVIAVGATDEDDNWASFSNYGKDWVSVGAPGSNIWSVLPNDQCGLTPPYLEACLWPLSGTSMASPHVAGAAAVVLRYLSDQDLLTPHTNYINSQVQCHIKQGADQVGVQGLDYSVRYCTYGRLNLAGALQPIDVCDGGGGTTDVAVTQISAPSPVVAGTQVDVEVTVQNTGNQDVGSFEVVLEDKTDSAIIGTQTVSSLAAGASIPLTFTWDTSSTSPEAHTLEAHHELADDNSSNNKLSTVVSVDEAKLTDIAVTQISAPSSVMAGDSVIVTVTVQNTGNQDVDSFEVVLEDSIAGVIGTQTVSSLAAGASIPLTFTWDTSSASSGDHELIASHDLDDNNIDNNTKSTWVTVTAANAEITLTAVTSKVNKSWIIINLSWSGATSSNVDIYRNDDLPITTINDGNYTDKISNQGVRSYIYKVCNDPNDDSPPICSNEVTLNF